MNLSLSVDMETAANDTRDKVSQAMRMLPRDCDPPVVAKADADANPIMFSLQLKAIKDLCLNFQKLLNLHLRNSFRQFPE